MQRLSYSCLKTSLSFLNLFYLVLGLILMTLPVYFKVNAILTSWPINGGIISVGVFLFMVSIAGFYGTCRQHQIVLFFYMVILVLLFILMFAFSVAALSLTTKQQNSVLKSGWDNLSTKTKAEFQKLGNCCGFDERNSSSTADPTCSEVKCFKDKQQCQTCKEYIVDHGFFTNFRRATGGVALFFSFTLFIGVYFAFRYRNLKNPRANPNEFL